MTTPAILAAEAEALRFLERLAALKAAIKAAEPDRRDYCARLGVRYSPGVSDAPKRHAALRRSSMDLTRALVAIRRTAS